jgi:hypothetical protein
MLILVSIGFRYSTPQQTRKKYPQMDVASMLKSKGASFVPFRNFSFENKWSFTATKTTALPLGAGFMLNSPMPMLDVSDWLLLMTVSTTGGGRIMAIVLFFGAWL